MDAARYERVRELFLAAEELPPEQQEAFLKIQTGKDTELFEEVYSLLEEHDAEFAKLEGESAVPVTAPPMSQSTTVFPVAQKPLKRSGDTTRQGDSANATQESSGKKKKAGITQHGAQRTHASPRYSDSAPSKRAPNTLLWGDRARRTRRQNSGWLWLAAILPTALIGWWTYRQVESTMEQSVRNELSVVSNYVAFASDQFMNDKAQLVESWSRQSAIRNAIVELVAMQENGATTQELREANYGRQIMAQLQSLSGFEEVKFVVWDDSYKTLASWLPGGEDIGNPVHPSGAANLARVMSGQTVLFGPERLLENTEGFIPETSSPVMAIIVPIHDQDDKIVAAMLVRGIGMFEEFSRMFIAKAAGLDAYAVNDDGIMITESPLAISMATQAQLDAESDEIAGLFRVADPGFELDRTNVSQVDRRICPLTISVAGATSGDSNVQTKPYANYLGQQVVGAWRWDRRWNVGVIIEQNAETAYDAARIVRFGFLLLGTLLSLTAFAVASRIARTSTAERAAVHPLSRYEVLGELGSGGMGMVLLAKHKQLGRETALKILRGDRHNKEDRLRFDREAKLAASLSNPHSVMIYDYGRSEEGEAFCVMEFLRGLTLQQVVARSGHQPIGRVLFIVSQICDALIEAHSTNLLHRDIKPQNIMLSLDASVGDWAVVFDYGLAKPLEPDGGVYQTSETIWSGTPMYMAPERFRAPSEMDPRSDIYSVGCVIYYLLSGRPPFVESEPESMFAQIIGEQPISISLHRNEEIPEEVNDVVMKCMAKDANDRYASIKELSRVVDQLRVNYPWNVDEARVWWKHHGGE